MTLYSKGNPINGSIRILSREVLNYLDNPLIDSSDRDVAFNSAYWMLESYKHELLKYDVAAEPLIQTLDTLFPKHFPDEVKNNAIDLMTGVFRGLAHSEDSQVPLETDVSLTRNFFEDLCREIPN